MKPATRTIYLDACVIIDLREKANNAGNLARVPGLLRELLGWSARRWCRVVTSELSLAECLVQPLRIAESGRSQAEQARRRVIWYRQSIAPLGVIESLAINRATLETAAQLRASHRALKLPDAIHISSAITAGADSFITRDDGIARIVPKDATSLAARLTYLPANDAWLTHLLAELKPS